MENEQFHNLNIKIAQKLQSETIDMLASGMRDEENTSDLLNVILSSHISSLSNCMLQLSKQHDEMHVMVKTFLDKLILGIKEIHPIKDIDVSVVEK